MSAPTNPADDRRIGTPPLAGLDFESSLRHIALDLVGNMMRFARRTNTSTVTAVVAGRSTVDTEVSLVIDTIVTDVGATIPTDSELPWIEIATSDVLAT